MPEGPEVETVVRTLIPRLVGRRILAVEFRKPRVLRGADPDEVAAGLAGRRVEAIERRGKFIVARLDRGLLTIHLGMTGRVAFDLEPDAHTRAIFTLDRGVMLYNDARMFGRLAFSEELPPSVAALGPEPLEMAAAEFGARMAGRRTRIKSLLLDQKFVRSVGNIYADESLFRARIHPLAVAAKMGRARVKRLHQAIQEVLAEAIAENGSSVSNYVDAEGREGSYQQQHKVYQRDGLPCAVCGTTIKRTVVGQRGTHYCPKCQRI